MSQLFTVVVCNVLISFNLVYSMAASYKESITDYTKSKTINGYLLWLFTLIAKLGNAVYGILRRITNFMCRNRKRKGIMSTDTMIGAVDFLIIFGISYFLYKMYGRYHAGFESEELVGIEKLMRIGDYIKHFLVTLLYYGFVYGLFGGDNCRIQETILSRLFNKIKDFGKDLCVKNIEVNQEFVRETIRDEVSYIGQTGNTAKLEILPYLKSTIGKIVSTIAEQLSTLSSLYIGIKNIKGFIAAMICSMLFSAIYMFTSGSGGNIASEADRLMDEVGIDPIGVITEVFTGFLFTMLVLILVKLALKAVIFFTPQGIQTRIYGFSYQLNIKCQDELQQMADNNRQSDAYADKYSSSEVKAAFENAKSSDQ